jgi:catechol 2,3-dioxygenase-like lactoylglutathione lyase family enzyme
MINRVSVATIYVLDKDEALDFYVNKLGLEVGNDVRQGDYRWLTVRVPGAETEISLEQPGAPLATVTRMSPIASSRCSTCSTSWSARPPSS